MPGPDAYEALVEELVNAIELRECGDVDAVDWALPTRIRDLERRLLEEHRIRPGRWRAEPTIRVDALASAGAPR